MKNWFSKLYNGLKAAAPMLSLASKLVPLPYVQDVVDLALHGLVAVGNAQAVHGDTEPAQKLADASASVQAGLDAANSGLAMVGKKLVGDDAARNAMIEGSLAYMKLVNAYRESVHIVDLAPPAPAK